VMNVHADLSRIANEAFVASERAAKLVPAPMHCRYKVDSGPSWDDNRA